MTLLRLAQQIEELSDIPAIWTVLCDGLASHGLKHVIYTTVTAQFKNQTLLCTLPDLFDETPPDQDPFLHWCCTTYTPTFTGQAFMDDYDYLNDAARDFIRRAGRLGFVSGIGIPVRLTGSERFGGFNMGTGFERAEFMDKIAPLSDELRLLCLLVHRRIEEVSSGLLDMRMDTAGFRALMVAGDDPSGALTELSPREREVLYLIARGLSRKECARMCNISVHTVAEYAKNAYRKLGLRNRAEAARFLTQHGEMS